MYWRIGLLLLIWAGLINFMFCGNAKDDTGEIILKNQKDILIKMFELKSENDSLRQYDLISTLYKDDDPAIRETINNNEIEILSLKHSLDSLESLLNN